MMRTTVRAAADAPAWAFTSTTTSSWRFNAALRRASDASEYPYNLEVVIPFAQTGRRGHHGTVGSDTEEKVTEVVADRAVLAGVHTSTDDLRFEFYTGSPDWTAKLHGQLQVATGISNLRVTCTPDAQWNVYRYRYRYDHDDWRRQPLSPRAFALIGLGMISCLLWIPVYGAYGPAWGGGVFAAFVIVIGARALASRYARWFPRRPAVIIGARVVAVSVYIIPFLAFTRMPAWIGLIASLLAGAAVVAGAWRARLIYRRGWRPPGLRRPSP
jgi:hypothetical protein